MTQPLDLYKERLQNRRVRPLRRPRLSVFALLGVLWLACLGIYASSYRPTPAWYAITFWIGIGAGVLFAILFVYIVLLGSSAVGGVQLALAILMMPLLGGSSGFVSVVYGTPIVLHHLLPKETHSRTVEIVEKERNHGRHDRRRCPYELKLDDVNMPGGAFVCVSADKWNNADVGDEITLRGRLSAVAFQIQSAAILD